MKSIVLATAMLAAMTTLAYASPKAPHAQSPQHREIGQREHRFPVRGFDMFERFDLNEDGVITRKEVKLVLEMRHDHDRKAGSVKFDGASKASGATQLNGSQSRHNSLVSQAPKPRPTDCLPTRGRK